MTEILESFVASFSLNRGSDLTWNSIGRLYGALSCLLTQSLQGGLNCESWITFNKLWLEVLSTVSAWIGENGGWVSHSLI